MYMCIWSYVHIHTHTACHANPAHARTHTYIMSVIRLYRAPGGSSPVGRGKRAKRQASQASRSSGSGGGDVDVHRLALSSIYTRDTQTKKADNIHTNRRCCTCIHICIERVHLGPHSSQRSMGFASVKKRRRAKTIPN